MMATPHVSNGNTRLSVQQFEELDTSIQTLIRKAVEARHFSYSPYSKFPVGACLELESGELVTGCNIENGSFTVGLCAERCALAKAISEGKRKFKSIAIVAYQEKSFTSPCGACRQFMAEFGNFRVFLAKPEMSEIVETTVNDLLPLGFEM